MNNQINEETRFPLIDFIMCLPEAMDLVSPLLNDHHKQVAYIAHRIGTELNLSDDQLEDLLLAGLLHDIGAFSLEERIFLRQLEPDNPHQHSEQGYLLLGKMDSLSNIADIVRFHHIPWCRGAGIEYNGEEVPIGARILHLADRVAVLINRQINIIGQVFDICERIQSASGQLFQPEYVDALMNIAFRESFWLDVISRSLDLSISQRSNSGTVDLDGLFSYSKLFSRIVDFRNSFTMKHSSGVAAVASAIARMNGFSESEIKMMMIAGLLHDLGRLAIPDEIIEKSDRLTKDDFDLMRCHSYFTYRILANVRNLDIISNWAGFHHERMDGNGYPFHLQADDLSTGARIMAVADVFTALLEDRPYRKGMSIDRTRQVMKLMTDNSELDPDIVECLISNFDEINSLRINAQKAAKEESLSTIEYQAANYK
ncbi:MAG: HD domain-containing protein [Candidatus Hatepunaea meridiana]|nr:HD domain-containing protein [Candidatus Hatepunaea meridiana]